MDEDECCMYEDEGCCCMYEDECPCMCCMYEDERPCMRMSAVVKLIDHTNLEVIHADIVIDHNFFCQEL